LRGDYGTIEIGDYSIVEDNCVLHARPDEKCVIGKRVTIGHGAIIHNANISDWVVVGMGAIVSDFAVVGEWGVIGEGAVVRNKQEIPAGKIAVGVPAKVIADVKDDYKELWTRYKGLYAELAKRNIEGLKKLD
jgi:carbonic anhydrase/acetyltransferase-like protein (isoleucine patch superfamily)